MFYSECTLTDHERVICSFVNTERDAFRFTRSEHDGIRKKRDKTIEVEETQTKPGREGRIVFENNRNEKEAMNFVRRDRARDSGIGSQNFGRRETFTPRRLRSY